MTPPGVRRQSNARNDAVDNGTVAADARRTDAVDVLVVGSANIDHTVPVDRHPRPGETVLGGDADLAAGGKGANVAVAAARLGARVGMLGAVGDDAGGRLVATALREAGVDIRTLRCTDAPTGAAYITVGADGENTIVVSPGANARVLPADVDATGTVGAARVLFAVLEIPLPTVQHAAALAAGGGVRVVLNASPVPPAALPPQLLQVCDPLVVNAAEAAALLGAADTGDGAQLATALRHLGARSAVVTLGAGGAAVAGPAGVHTIPAGRVDVVDTTGAGDAFAGALCRGLAGGARLDDVVADAVAVAADSVTRRGAQTVRGD